MLPHVHLFCRRLLSSQAAASLRKPKQNVTEYFRYTRAIVASQSALGDVFARQSIRTVEPSDPIDLEKARRNHSEYVSELKKLIPEVHIVPCDATLPDQVFVEDPAVVLNGRAFLTPSGPAKPRSRASEAGPMRRVLEDIGLDVVVATDPEAAMDGGDVLFTGREFLVGLSRRTNAVGVEALAKAFPQWPVTGITVAEPVLHLKSMSSMVGVDIIAISESRAGNIAWKEIEAKAHHRYDRLAFPDDAGANGLFINGVVLHPPKEEYPESFKVWEQLDCPKVPLHNSELGKADGCLSCNSILIE